MKYQVTLKQQLETNRDLYGAYKSQVIRERKVSIFQLIISFALTIFVKHIFPNLERLGDKLSLMSVQLA